MEKQYPQHDQEQGRVSIARVIDKRRDDGQRHADRAHNPGKTENPDYRKTPGEHFPEGKQKKRDIKKRA